MVKHPNSSKPKLWCQGFSTSPGFSNQLIGHLNQQTNGVRMSTGRPGSGIMMPLRNIAPKPPSQPELMPGFGNPASFLQQAGLPKPTTSLSQVGQLIQPVLNHPSFRTT